MKKLIIILIGVLAAFASSAQTARTYNGYYRYGFPSTGTFTDSTNYATQNLWWYDAVSHKYRFSENGVKYSLRSYVNAFSPVNFWPLTGSATLTGDVSINGGLSRSVTLGPLGNELLSFETDVSDGSSYASLQIDPYFTSMSTQDIATSISTQIQGEPDGHITITSIDAAGSGYQTKYLASLVDGSEFSRVGITNTVPVDVLTQRLAYASGVATAGFGIKNKFVIENGFGSQPEIGNALWTYEDITNTAEDIKYNIKGVNNGSLTDFFAVHGGTDNQFQVYGPLKLKSLASEAASSHTGSLIYDAGSLKLSDGASWNTVGAGTVTSVTGTTNRITSSGGATPAIDISSSYVGQSSITTLGTIGTGTWNATTIGVSKGGTGLTSIAAKSIWLANSANTITSVTPGAGQSIRINAGNTAWEAYTPAVTSTASNGLTKVTNDIQLGGSATSDITINTSTHDFSVLTTSGDIDLNVNSEYELIVHSSVIGMTENSTGNVIGIGPDVGGVVMQANAGDIAINTSTGSINILSGSSLTMSSGATASIATPDGSALDMENDGNILLSSGSGTHFLGSSQDLGMVADGGVTAAGTTGNRTINATWGTVNFAASATSLTVTNSLITVDSLIIPVKRTNDSTCKVDSIVASTGSFIIRMTAACTAETSVGFMVMNAF